MLSSTISTAVLLLATFATAVPVKMGSTTGAMAIVSSEALNGATVKRATPFDPLDPKLAASIRELYKSAPPSIGPDYVDPVTRTNLHRRDQRCISTRTEVPVVGIPLFKSWTVSLETPYDNQADGCGRGFLDNYRGRCGLITAWGCGTEPNSVITMTFNTHPWCAPQSISDATKAASGGRIVDCADS